jgi:Na+-translocating ferredoxin:NAD+ oxidoreductase RnfG subunit
VAIDEIDGVTGATITSQAVRDMLNSISALKGEAQGE